MIILRSLLVLGPCGCRYLGGAAGCGRLSAREAVVNRYGALLARVIASDLRWQECQDLGDVAGAGVEDARRLVLMRALRELSGVAS